MISVIRNDEVYEIKFSYDPNIVSIIRSLPQRNYVPNAKKWIIPKDQLQTLLDYFKGTDYEKQIKILNDHSSNQELSDVSAKIPNIDISNVKTYVRDGFDLYDHQKDFIKFSLHRELIEHNMSGFLLCDEPGLGKTLEGMNLALYNRRNFKFKHCLIICCVNSAKYNWVSDIEKHSNGKFHPYLLGSRKKRNGEIKDEMTNADKVYDIDTMSVYGDSEKCAPYFLVTNIEAFRMKDGKHYPFADAIIRAIESGSINMIIIDEIHKNMSPSSSQGKQILKIKDKTQKKCNWLCLTGTPIVNRPTDVFTPLRLIDAVDCKSYYKWCIDFCVSSDYGTTDIVGYKNIPTLKAILQNNMLRRRKEDVLDMPPIVFNDRYILNTLYQSKLYTRLEQEVKARRDEIIESMNPLAMMLQLRQVCGSPELVDEELDVDDNYIKKNSKLQELLELIDEIHERGEKVIVFSNWVRPLHTLFKFIENKFSNSVCQYHGEMTLTERNASKFEFTNPGSEKFVLLGTIGAAGISHTFTCASNVIFYDEPFTYADKQQAWERVYRIGTESCVNVYTLIVKNTIEERVHEIVYNKKAISDMIVDNLQSLSNEKLFDALIGK